MNHGCIDVAAHAAIAYGERCGDMYDGAQTFALTLALALQDLDLDPDAIEPDVMRAVASSIRTPLPAWVPALRGIWDSWHDGLHATIALRLKVDL